MIVDGKTNKKDWRAIGALIVDALDRGKTVCGIASDPDSQLPALLRAAADLVLTVPAPTPELMRKAIRLHTGRSAPALTALDIGGLDLMDLAAALRPGTTPKACVKRLRAASATRSVSTSHDSTPLLRDLSGYGEAKTWCLATLADIEAVRAGTLAPGELESAIFYGPPGTGKTTLARSLAKTSRLPLIQTSVADRRTAAISAMSCNASTTSSRVPGARRPASCSSTSWIRCRTAPRWTTAAGTGGRASSIPC